MSEQSLPIIRHLNGAEYELESQSGRTYFLNADKPSCTCPHFTYRCLEERKLCKHLQLLAEVLEAQRACPVCHGRAFIWPSFPHADEPGKGLSLDPIPCGMCEGTGTRAGCDPHFLRIHEEGATREAGQAEQEALRKLFS